MKSKEFLEFEKRIKEITEPEFKIRDYTNINTGFDAVTWETVYIDKQ